MYNRLGITVVTLIRMHVFKMLKASQERVTADSFFADDCIMPIPPIKSNVH